MSYVESNEAGLSPPISDQNQLTKTGMGQRDPSVTYPHKADMHRTKDKPCFWPFQAGTAVL